MTRRRALWLLGGTAFVLGAVLAQIDLRMWDEGGPGIIGFELAGSEERAHQILAEWGSDGRSAARLSLWLDYAYLTAYGAFGALLAATLRDLARRRGWRRFAAFGRVAVLLTPAAACFDALEDVCLLLVVGGHGGSTAPVLGTAFALCKFALLGIALAYAGLSLLRANRILLVSGVGVAVLVAVLLLVNQWVSSRETHPARADGGRIVELADGSDLHIREDGDPSKPPLVLIHGFAASMRWFDAVTPALARDAHVIRIDLLGHGGSEKPRGGYSMEHQADLVAAVMERLGVRRASVVGHSMGGIVATALVQRHRGLVARLMTIGTPPDRDDEGALTGLSQRLAFWPVTGPAIDRLISYRVAREEVERAFEPEFDPPRRLVEDIFERTTFNSFSKTGNALSDYLDAESLPKRLAATGVPLTALFGEDDWRADDAIPKYNAVPGARTVVMEGQRHCPQVEVPARTAALIAAFARG
jgi:pimeloyl-ACP methyl ester carboxylesterase